MKKNYVGPITTVIILILLIAGFIYFQVTINRLDKKMIKVQTTITDNSTKLNGVVNFFNSTLQSQNK